MRLDMSQQMRMLQQMKLAPRMIQSMEILQLPVMALEERIRQEEEQNPALEVGASTTETPSTDLEAESETPAAKTDLLETNGEKSNKEQDEFDAAYEQLEREWDENYIPGHGPSRSEGIELSNKKQDAIQNVAERGESLQDHLLEQLTFEEESDDVLAFAEYLVANLNGRGFLNGSLLELLTSYDGEIDEDGAELALQVLQSLDPRGVGARDLRECLLLQLDEAEIEHCDVLRTLISNHLEDIEHNRLPAIERKTGYPIPLILEARDQLRHLDPNPGGRFTTGAAQYVVPDVMVEPGSNGEFVLKLNDYSTPQVRISKQYMEMLRERQGDAKALEWVKKKIAAARWLIDSIEQRRSTLEKVTRAIIEHQREFLEKGPENIEPLKMQQIADKVGVHVTTVSRAVDGKWVQTPRGIFPLKRFFGGGTVTATGEEVAWDTIKRKLTEIIADEDKTSPYSDDELVKKLGEVGYPLARRTVTKYRKMLNIPASRQRKEHG